MQDSTTGNYHVETVSCQAETTVRLQVSRFESETFDLCFGKGLHIPLRLGTTQDGEEAGLGDSFDGLLIAVGFDDVFNDLFLARLTCLSHFTLLLVEKGRVIPLFAI